MPPTTLETSRLTLRQWISQDLPKLAEFNADPEVMRYFPKPLSRFESDAMALRFSNLIKEQGWGVWAVELKKSNDFIGFVGLNAPSIDLPFTPCIEIVWRLHKDYWGKGYATEAAEAVIKVAFEDLAFDEIVSFTATINTPSQSVMQRLGMTNTGENFYHPSIAPDHDLAEHVLYKISKKAWQQRHL